MTYNVNLIPWFLWCIFFECLSIMQITCSHLYEQYVSILPNSKSSCVCGYTFKQDFGVKFSEMYYFILKLALPGLICITLKKKLYGIVWIM